MDNSTIKHQEVLDSCSYALSELQKIQDAIRLSFTLGDDVSEEIVPLEAFQRTYYVLDRYKKCTQELSEQIRIFMDFLRLKQVQLQQFWRNPSESKETGTCDQKKKRL